MSVEHELKYNTYASVNGNIILQI